MSTKTVHGQMSVVDEHGNVTILHQETSAIDVLVDRSGNTQGDSGYSAIPSDVDSLQKLTNKLGTYAFKSEIKSEDLSSVDEDILVIGPDASDTDIVYPESEINDDVISKALTWSSEKIDKLTLNFYIPLVHVSDNNYTSETPMDKIEEAYQHEKRIWIVADDLFLPLTTRTNANEWIFSGYLDEKAFDITLTPNTVTFTYKEVATMEDRLPNPNALKLTGAINATYDGTSEVEVPVAPITIGINENSIQQLESGIAGVKGFYWTDIYAMDSANPCIMLSTKNGNFGFDSEYVQCPWKQGDKITIHNDAKWEECVEVEEVMGDALYVRGPLPFTTLTRESGHVTDQAVFCPAKPDQGAVDFGQYSAAFGDNCKAINFATFAAGRDNVSTGQYSTTFGRQNTTGYCALSAGRQNTNLGDHSIVGGNKNTNDYYAYASLVNGVSNFNAGRRALVVGTSNKNNPDKLAGDQYGYNAIVGGSNNTNNGDCVIVSGTTNTINGDNGLTVGSGNIHNSNCGIVGGTNNTITGNNSIVSGSGNTVAAATSAVFGTGHTVESTAYNVLVAGSGHTVKTKYGSAVVGIENTVTGEGAFAMGKNCKGYGTYAFAGGFNNEANGNYSFAFGKELKTDSIGGQVVFGIFNKTNTNARLIVANGTSNTARKNVFEVLNDGIVVNGVTLTSSKLQKIINFIDSIE